jgi:hypothetical protein
VFLGYIFVKLVVQGMEGVGVAQRLLLRRTTTLLERELRRTALDERMIELSIRVKKFRRTA